MVSQVPPKSIYDFIRLIYPVGDWEGFGLPFLFLVKLLGLLIVFLLLGCSTPSVEIGKVTIVIKEPIRSAHKGEQQ